MHLLDFLSNFTKMKNFFRFSSDFSEHSSLKWSLSDLKETSFAFSAKEYWLQSNVVRLYNCNCFTTVCKTELKLKLPRNNEQFKFVNDLIFISALILIDTGHGEQRLYYHWKKKCKWKNWHHVSTILIHLCLCFWIVFTPLLLMTEFVSFIILIWKSFKSLLNYSISRQVGPWIILDWTFCRLFDIPPWFDYDWMLESNDLYLWSGVSEL